MRNNFHLCEAVKIPSQRLGEALIPVADEAYYLGVVLGG